MMTRLGHSWLQRVLPAIALAGLGGACGGDDLLLPNEGQPATVAAVRGDRQNGTAGEPVSEMLVVEVKDRFGNPVGQIEVSWQAEGGGSAGPTLLVTASARYLGQNFEQEVAVPLDADGDLVELLAERFHRQHEAVYGYRLAGAVVELVHLNATATERRAPTPTAALSPGGADPIGVRPVSFETARWIETPIYRRGAVGAGASISGPAVIEEVDSTTIVFPGQVACAHVSGALFIEHVAGREDRAGETQELSRA